MVTVAGAGMRADRVGIVFGAMVAALLSMLVLLLPVGEAPDELSHVLRADGLRLGAIIGHRDEISLFGRSVPSAGVSAHHGFLFAARSLDPATGKIRSDGLAQASGADWGTVAYVHIPNTAVYGPFFYVPAALAIAASEVAGLSPYQAMLAARWVNGFFYALMAGLAVMLAARGRLLLLLLLGLPMALSLGASVNQDGLIIAASALTAALFSRARDGRGRGWEWGAGALLLLAVLMAKPPFLPLLLLLPGAPSQLVAGRAALGSGGVDLRRRLAVTGLVGGLALAWTLFNMLHVSVPFDKPPYPAGPWAGSDATLTLTDPAWQARILLSAPSRLLTMPLSSLEERAWEWWMHFVGVLGPMTHPFTDDLYGLWPLLAGLLLLLAVPVPRRVQAGVWLSGLLDAVLPVLAVLVSAWLIIIAQYLSWTPVGSVRVEGVQGRYFIPLLPFLILALPSHASPSPWRGRLADGGALLLALAGAVCSAWLLLHAYYIG